MLQIIHNYNVRIFLNIIEITLGNSYAFVCSNVIENKKISLQMRSMESSGNTFVTTYSFLHFIPF